MTQAAADFDGTPTTTPEIPANGQLVEENKDVRMWAMLCHLSALAGGVIPFGHIVLPLIIWQIKKAESPFIDAAGKEAVNFNITATIYLFAAALTIFIFVGFLLVPAVAIAAVVLVIMAGIKANNGEAYRYPYTIRLIK